MGLVNRRRPPVNRLESPTPHRASLLRESIRLLPVVLSTNPRVQM